jgi:hypothetical protein
MKFSYSKYLFSRIKPDAPVLCPSELVDYFGSCSAVMIIVKVKAKFFVGLYCHWQK